MIAAPLVQLDQVAVLPRQQQRLIREPDPLVIEATLRIGPYRPAEATRRYLHLAFRDAYDVLDLTYARGGFWRDPLPPGIVLTTNNVDPDAPTDLHVDFTATGLPDASFDLVVLDPPHLASLGPRSLMRRRFGTVRGAGGLERLIRAGIREAWRLARIGVLVKLADHSQSYKFLMLTSWAEDELGVRLYWRAQTYRPPFGGTRQSLAPRSNGADWLIWRRDGHALIDFDRRYERQKALRLARQNRAQKLARRCAICNAPIGDRRSDSATCSSSCRQRAYRRRLTLTRESEAS